MKRTSILLLTIFLSAYINVRAQENNNNSSEFVVIDHSNDDFKSLLGSKGSNGAYLSIDVSGGEMNNNQVFESGARIAWIVNHSFAFGLAGYGFAQNIVSDPDTEITQIDLAGGYGGLLLEPIIFSKEIIHLSVPIILGVGGAGTDYNDSGYNHHTNTYQGEGDFDDIDAFFMVRPGLELEVNVSRFFRIALGGYYHHALGLELEDFSNNALNGFTMGVSFKFGWF